MISRLALFLLVLLWVVRASAAVPACDSIPTGWQIFAADRCATYQRFWKAYDQSRARRFVYSSAFQSLGPKYTYTHIEPPERLRLRLVPGEYPRLLPNGKKEYAVFDPTGDMPEISIAAEHADEWQLWEHETDHLLWWLIAPSRFALDPKFVGHGGKLDPHWRYLQHMKRWLYGTVPSTGIKLDP